MATISQAAQPLASGYMVLFSMEVPNGSDAAHMVYEQGEALRLLATNFHSVSII